VEAAPEQDGIDAIDPAAQPALAGNAEVELNAKSSKPAR
jgi:hypothetical protein